MSSCSWSASSSSTCGSTTSEPLPMPAVSENSFFEEQIQAVARFSLEQLLDLDETLPAEINRLVAELESEDLRGEARERTEMNLTIARIRIRALPELINHKQKDLVSVHVPRGSAAAAPNEGHDLIALLNRQKVEIAQLSLLELIKRRDTLPGDFENLEKALHAQNLSHSRHEEISQQFRILRASAPLIAERIAALKGEQEAAAAAKPRPANLEALYLRKAQLEAQIEDFGIQLTRPDLPSRKMVEQRYLGTQDRLAKLLKDIAKVEA